MWWNARTAIVMPKPGGLWMAAWGKDEDSPDYITAARLKVFDPPRRLVMHEFEYQSKSMAVPFSRQLETEFHITEQGPKTELRVMQTGFPDGSDADAFYEGCCQGWAATLQAISEFFQGPAEMLELDGDLV